MEKRAAVLWIYYETENFDLIGRIINCATGARRPVDAES